MPGSRPGRNWHEIYLLVLSITTGLAGFLAPDARSNALDAAFPGWGQTAWYAGLLVGSATGIVGILLAGRPSTAKTSEIQARRHLTLIVTGLTLERFAMLLLTGLCVAYVLGAIAYAGVNRVATGLGVAYVAAFALANGVRARQIRLILSRARSAVDSTGGETR